jgi:hypothetical protein
VFAASLLDDQPIFDAAAIRRFFRSLASTTPAQRVLADALLNRVLSLTLMHQRMPV